MSTRNAGWAVGCGCAGAVLDWRSRPAHRGGKQPSRRVQKGGDLTNWSNEAVAHSAAVGTRWTSPLNKSRGRRPGFARLRVGRGPRVDHRLAPRPAGMAGLPGKKGRTQSTGTSHQHRQVLARQGPAATTWWPLLSKQHPAHPRTGEAPRLDVTGPAEKDSPTNCLALHDR